MGHVMRTLSSPPRIQNQNEKNQLLIQNSNCSLVSVEIRGGTFVCIESDTTLKINEILKHKKRIIYDYRENYNPLSHVADFSQIQNSRSCDNKDCCALEDAPQTSDAIS